MLRHASLLCLPGSREALPANASPGNLLQIFILNYFSLSLRKHKSN
jgi:hypothetical protein